MSKFDLVIRGGTVFDGSGGEPFAADVGVNGSIIAAVGQDLDGKEVIDAKGCIVTPGFVDPHTHYDGQITWENRLSPSSDHGVTTVVMGNCAVGFAPCRKEDRQIMIEVMSGVEDIPEVVITDGVPWKWETFPEYLDFLEKRESDIDFATLVPHGAVRVYAMGKRGADRELPFIDDLREMTRLVREGVEAGALGVSSSRTMAHRDNKGRLAPVETSGDAELLALARGVKEGGGSCFELVADFNDVELGGLSEFEIIRKVAEVSDCPVNFTLVQGPHMPDGWRVILTETEKARKEGLELFGNVSPRGVGMCFGLNLSFIPFSFCDAYREIANLPLEEKVARMRDPEVRKAILSAKMEDANHTMVWLAGMFDKMVPMDDSFTYEPTPEQTVEGRAKAQGRDPREVAYDLLLEEDGNRILYLPVTNYVDGTLDVAREMIDSDATVISLGDGGAHYGLICDASYTTFTLTHWGRDRKEGRFPLNRLINELTRRPALAVGLTDRGLIKPGMKADLNVIDFDNLTLHNPVVRNDLPHGGRRMVQKVDGYVATMVSGQVTYRNGEPTGALPGRLVRGGSAKQSKAA
ncbi:N-acyl-D-amino-acid deacylase family protein [Novosphingobium malaysiense]|uniref:Amidohydrolase n=1 Tax=Novosphingobium malaysiense TaxID=1348853 RepID=A0A0B1ZKX1_9SPHN|nr:amidohydrolase family protein [Novosphingobium malaysiense]KHK89828.1 amidohydrolase [Novosphingobium malaysiense]